MRDLEHGFTTRIPFFFDIIRPKLQAKHGYYKLTSMSSLPDVPTLARLRSLHIESKCLPLFTLGHGSTGAVDEY